MAYSPADAVVVLRVNPVVVDTTVTVAPGTTALLVSVIVPAITPVSAWPNRQTEASSRMPSKLTTLSVVFFISNTPSCCRFEVRRYGATAPSTSHLQNGGIANPLQV